MSTVGKRSKSRSSSSSLGVAGSLDRVVASLLTSEEAPSFAISDLLYSHIEDSATLENSRSSAPWITTINRQIHEAKDRTSRLQALSLLEVTLQSCSDDVLVKHGVGWAKRLSLFMKGTRFSVHLPQVFRMYASLLTRAAESSELSRAIGDKDFSKILRLVIDHISDATTTQLCLEGLRLLRTCCVAMPNPTKPVLGRIKNLCLEQMTSVRSEVVDAATELYASMCHCATASQRSTRWYTMVVTLCNGAHKVLDELLDGIDEGTTYTPVAMEGDAKAQEIELPHSLSNTSSTSGTIVLSNLCQGLLLTIAQCYRHNPGSHVHTPTKTIMALCERVLALDADTVSTGSLLAERVTLVTLLLPSLHVATWRLLSVVVEVHGLALWQYAPQILTSANALLGYYCDKPVVPASSRGRSHTLVCASIIQCVRTLLLSCAPAATTVQDTLTQFVHTVLGLLQPQEKHIVRFDIQLTQHERKQHQQQPHGSRRNAHKHNATADETKEELSSQAYDLVQECLQCVDVVIMTFFPSLPLQLRQAMDAFVVGVVANHVTMPPFDNPMCRQLLYGLLQTCVLSPTPNTPVIAHFAVGLLTKGMREDVDFNVRQSCKRALLACDAVLRPRHPSVRKPITVAQGIVVQGAESATLQTAQHSSESDVEEESDGDNDEMEHGSQKKQEQEQQGEATENEDTVALSEGKAEGDSDVAIPAPVIALATAAGKRAADQRLAHEEEEEEKEEEDNSKEGSSHVKEDTNNSIVVENNDNNKNENNDNDDDDDDAQGPPLKRATLEKPTSDVQEENNTQNIDEEEEAAEPHMPYTINQDSHNNTDDDDEDEGGDDDEDDFMDLLVDEAPDS